MGSFFSTHHSTAPWTARAARKGAVLWVKHTAQGTPEQVYVSQQGTCNLSYMGLDASSITLDGVHGLVDVSTCNADITSLHRIKAAAGETRENAIEVSGTAAIDINTLADAVALRLHKRMRFPATDAAGVGQEAIARAEVVSPQQLLRLVAEPLPPTLDAVRAAWPTCTKEAEIQDLLLVACNSLSAFSVLDTHKDNYYKDPTAKICISLSDSDSARWPTLVSPIEVKLMLRWEADYKEAVGQLRDRWEKVREAQPTRQIMVGAVIGRDGIELWSFSRGGHCQRTSLTALHWEQGDTGWQMLAAYLRAPGSDLRYIPLPVPALFPIPTPDGEQLLDDFKPLAGLPHLRPLYTARLSASGDNVVVKLGSEAAVEHEASLLSMLSSARLPRLLASGELAHELAPGVSHYLVISPLGQLLGDDSPTQLLRTVFRDVATAIKHLLERGILHRDISPSNIIQAGGRGVLVDLHAARPTNITSRSWAARAGKLAYMALSLHSGQGQHSAATDLESLFYSLMDVASGGRALLWRDIVIEEHLYYCKFTTVHSPEDWRRALAQCREELRPQLDCLRNVVCGGNDVDAYLAGFGVHQGSS